MDQHGSTEDPNDLDHSIRYQYECDEGRGEVYMRSARHVLNCKECAQSVQNFIEIDQSVLQHNYLRPTIENVDEVLNTAIQWEKIMAKVEERDFVMPSASDVAEKLHEFITAWRIKIFPLWKDVRKSCLS